MHGEPDQSLCGCALAVRNKFACWQIVWLSLPISRMASCMIYSHVYVIPPSTQPHNWSSLCVYVFPFNYETATACLPRTLHGMRYLPDLTDEIRAFPAIAPTSYPLHSYDMGDPYVNS